MNNVETISSDKLKAILSEILILQNRLERNIIDMVKR